MTKSISVIFIRVFLFLSILFPLTTMSYIIIALVTEESFIPIIPITTSLMSMTSVILYTLSIRLAYRETKNS